MKDYEVIHEIPNSCSGNQMRDVFFLEVSCDSPLEWVKSRHKSEGTQFTQDVLSDGSVVIYAVVNDFINKYIFTLE